MDLREDILEQVVRVVVVPDADADEPPETVSELFPDLVG